MEGRRDQPRTLGSSAAYRQQLLYRLLRCNRLEQWLQEALEVALKVGRWVVHATKSGVSENIGVDLAPAGTDLRSSAVRSTASQAPAFGLRGMTRRAPDRWR